MTAPVWTRDEVDSPCVQVCVIHQDTGLCLGCKRSMAEIANWSKMSRDERRQIMAALEGRTAAPTRRRGGRKARTGGS